MLGEPEDLGRAVRDGGAAGRVGEALHGEAGERGRQRAQVRERGRRAGLLEHDGDGGVEHVGLVAQQLERAQDVLLGGRVQLAQGRDEPVAGAVAGEGVRGVGGVVAPRQPGLRRTTPRCPRARPRAAGARAGRRARASPAARAGRARRRAGRAPSRPGRRRCGRRRRRRRARAPAASPRRSAGRAPTPAGCPPGGAGGGRPAARRGARRARGRAPRPPPPSRAARS